MLKYLILIHLCFGLFGAVGEAMAVNSEKGNTVLFVDVYSSPGRTVIVSEQKKTLVDYEIGKIAFRQHDGECHWYRLNSPEPVGASGEVFSRRKALLGEVQRTGTSDQENRGGKNGAVILEFGGLLNRMRTVIHKPLIWFGLEFSPHFEKLLVDRNHPQQAELAKIADYNERFYVSEPLVRQVDPLGLLRLAGGVVSVREGASSGITERYRYVRKHYEFNMDQCREKNNGP